MYPIVANLLPRIRASLSFADGTLGCTATQLQVKSVTKQLQTILHRVRSSKYFLSSWSWVDGELPDLPDGRARPCVILLEKYMRSMRNSIFDEGNCIRWLAG